jgi:UDP-N-acetyl-alpha-D-quinovosamine dehydrogenase
MVVRRVLRRGTSEGISTDADVLVDEIGPSTSWDRALPGMDAVVHLAARVHVMRDRSADPLSAFRSTNVLGTERLAVAAARAGVCRFVFSSSIKAMGEHTLERPFVESDEPRPEDPYGLSKLEAERALQKVGASTGMSVSILRLPLVYGPGVKGNFFSLLGLCARGVPLPFASIENRRSMLGLDNLAGAISRCLADPRAAGKTYLLSDGEDVSTPDLIRRLSQCFGRRPRLIPFPLGVLKLGCRAVGHYAAYQRLTGSLQVDSRAIAAELGWRPDASLDDGLRKTVDWFVAR